MGWAHVASSFFPLSWYPSSAQPHSLSASPDEVDKTQFPLKPWRGVYNLQTISACSPPFSCPCWSQQWLRSPGHLGAALGTLGQPQAWSQCHLPPARACVSLGPVQHPQSRPAKGQASVAAGCHSSPKEPGCCCAGVCSDTAHTQMSCSLGMEAGKVSWQKQAQRTLLTQPRAQAPDGKMLNPQGVISSLSMGKTLYRMKYAPRLGGEGRKCPSIPPQPPVCFCAPDPRAGPSAG